MYVYDLGLMMTRCVTVVWSLHAVRASATIRVRPGGDHYLYYLGLMMTRRVTVAWSLHDVHASATIRVRPGGDHYVAPH